MDGKTIYESCSHPNVELKVIVVEYRNGLSEGEAYEGH